MGGSPGRTGSVRLPEQRRRPAGASAAVVRHAARAAGPWGCPPGELELPIAQLSGLGGSAWGSLAWTPRCGKGLGPGGRFPGDLPARLTVCEARPLLAAEPTEGAQSAAAGPRHHDGGNHLGRRRGGGTTGSATAAPPAPVVPPFWRPSWRCSWQPATEMPRMLQVWAAAGAVHVSCTKALQPATPAAERMAQLLPVAPGLQAVRCASCAPCSLSRGRRTRNGGLMWATRRQGPSLMCPRFSAACGRCGRRARLPASSRRSSCCMRRLGTQLPAASSSPAVRRPRATPQRCKVGVARVRLGCSLPALPLPGHVPVSLACSPCPADRRRELGAWLAAIRFAVEIGADANGTWGPQPLRHVLAFAAR